METHFPWFSQVADYTLVYRHGPDGHRWIVFKHDQLFAIGVDDCIGAAELKCVQDFCLHFDIEMADYLWNTIRTEFDAYAS